MRTKPLVKFQIVILAILTVLVVWRARTSPSKFEGKIAISNVGTGTLVSRHFVVQDGSVDVLIDATGAFETEDSGSDPAVYAWILNRDTEEVVWSMLGAPGEREGLLVHVEDDERSLDPGRYTVFMTSLGPTSSSRRGGTFLGLRPHWTNDSSPWGFSLSVDSNVGDRILTVSESVAADWGRKSDATVLWDETTLGDRARRTLIFRALTQTDLQIDAQLELCRSSECDGARIRGLTDQSFNWKVSRTDAHHAGGGRNNYRYTGTLEMMPGVYRAVVFTDAGHARGDWLFNPPYNPYMWGMRLTVESGNAVKLDPWNNLEPNISMLGLGNDQTKRARFEVTDTVTVFIAGMGEIWSSGTRYDYGWMENESTGERVWEMTHESTEPAGGDRTNRKAESVLTLPPGRYKLYFQTDDSHSSENWLRSKPTHPDRWGVALFVLESTAESSIEVLSRSDDWDTEVEVIGEVVQSSGSLIVAHTAVGNDADYHGEFSLEDETRVRIVGMGEISTNGRYDYGWIEAAETGEHVWEMTLQNTTHAGGEDRNRRFDGVLVLPAGNYVLRYKSDFDYAYGDFGEGAPTRPGDWGIALYRVE